MSNPTKVEFKPLNGSPSDQSDDDDDADEDDLEGHSRLAYRKFQLVQDTNSHVSNESRSLLKIYLVSLLLIIVIVANCSQYLDNNRVTITSHTEKLIIVKNSSTSSPSIQTNPIDPIHETPSSMSIVEHFEPSAKTLANQYYSKSNIDAKWWDVGFRGDDNKYVTITNYIRADKLFDSNSSVTFTTQASGNFLHHTIEICKRWDGPISLSVFAPGYRFNDAITIIKFMQNCLPDLLSKCIKDKVSWHLIYDSATGPVAHSLGYPDEHLNFAHYKQFTMHGECPKLASQDAKEMIREFSEKLANITTLHHPQEPHYVYPINVLRNVARLAANTHHVLACDIELYPSVNLVPLFKNYMARHNPSDEFHANKYIFALPIFEVNANVTPPRTKAELSQLFKQGDAIFFHKFVCDYCQDFPNRLGWIESLDRADDDELSVFVKTQRDKSRSSWEPIFIGTNEDPLYDDRLTWDGRRDKMGQMYEMCLQNYYILIVDNAFLVHSPGIKHIDKADVMSRVQYIVSNNQIYESTIARLKTTYANNETLSKC